ncbi:hypothetical protein HK44_011995 [Pseudomonas fluorescens HK44]|uniref:Uncharacterized protein n=1 Tax=Pseudomonas fluorescens HK44 TaxID=1042209 RepID=A0A010T4G6_PSEFL|nr:hypothetical protein [Pseudomonas fluorescens]EXF92422.1 hypothetical protein HK44_011995 [Pseudomonas fluorescens HK44]
MPDTPVPDRELRSDIATMSVAPNTTVSITPQYTNGTWKVDYVPPEYRPPIPGPSVQPYRDRPPTGNAGTITIKGEYKSPVLHDTDAPLTVVAVTETNPSSKETHTTYINVITQNILVWPDVLLVDGGGFPRELDIAKLATDGWASYEAYIKDPGPDSGALSSIDESWGRVTYTPGPHTPGLSELFTTIDEVQVKNRLTQKIGSAYLPILQNLVNAPILLNQGQSSLPEGKAQFEVHDRNEQPIKGLTWQVKHGPGSIDSNGLYYVNPNERHLHGTVVITSYLHSDGPLPRINFLVVIPLWIFRPNAGL